MQPQTRSLNTVSPTELQRRWTAVRSRMREAGIDVLIAQNSSDWVGGYTRWFSNTPATNGYLTTLVFPLDGGMALIEQGPFDLVREFSAADAALTGIARKLTTPSYPSIEYTASYDAVLAAKEARGFDAKRVGLVAPAAMYHGFAAQLRASLAELDVVDATELVDRIKALKSEEERGLIRQVAAMQDEILARVRDFIRPGLQDYEIAAYAQYVGQQLGSEQGIFLCSSAPPGQAATFQPRYRQGRTLQSGDVFSLLIENNGPGGYYTELSRIFVLGRATSELRDAHASVLDAQRYALSLLQPGARCAEIAARLNDYLRAKGLGEERRLSAHGMGYDMVERPLVRADETLSLEEHMSIVCHPGLVNERLFVHNTDNYLLEARGVSESLHRTPKQIFEIG
jgi:Xaa-Pro aminopeptidase